MLVDFGPDVPTPTWEELVAAEPELADLRQLCEDWPMPSGPYCQTYAFRVVKPLMSRLVGWTARKNDPLLFTPEAYKLVLRTLEAALPECRHEGQPHW